MENVDEIDTLYFMINFLCRSDRSNRKRRHTSVLANANTDAQESRIQN